MESVLVQYLVENYGRKKGLKTRNFVLNSMVEFNKKLSGLRYEYNSKLSGYEVFSTRVNSETCRKLQNERALEKTAKKNHKTFKFYAKWRPTCMTLNKYACWQRSTIMIF